MSGTPGDMTCEQCGGPATVHLAEIKDGCMAQCHLCEACGAAVIAPAVPVDVVLDGFANDRGRPGGTGQ